MYKSDVALIPLIVLVGLSAPGSCAELAIRNLAQGQWSAIGKPRREVIREQTLWENLWKSQADGSQPTVKVPAVNFEKEMVVAVAVGLKPTGGYSIRVSGVTTNSNELKIYIAERKPAPGGLVAQSFTSPFHFVAVPKIHLKPQFMIDDRTSKK